MVPGGGTLRRELPSVSTQRVAPACWAVRNQSETLGAPRRGCSMHRTPKNLWSKSQPSRNWGLNQPQVQGVIGSKSRRQSTRVPVAINSCPGPNQLMSGSQSTRVPVPINSCPGPNQPGVSCVEYFNALQHGPANVSFPKVDELLPIYSCPGRNQLMSRSQSTRVPVPINLGSCVEYFNTLQPGPTNVSFPNAGELLCSRL